MKNVILIILVIYTGMVKAQPAIDLINLFDHGGGSPELFVDVYLTDQGDYLACGQSGQSPWIIRIDSDGNKIWDYQADVGGRLFSIIQADNGDVITVGGIDGGNFGAMRLNGDGEPVWQRDYFRGRGEAIIELKGGEFLTCGNREGKGYAMMMSADGDIIWQHEYGPDSTASFLTEMRETDGGVVIVGHVNNRYANGLIIKVNIENGDVIWTQQYELRNPSRSLYFYSIVSGDFGFAVGGTYLGEERGFALIKIRPNGDLIDNIAFDPIGGAWFECLNKISDGGYILVGYKNTGRYYPYAIRTDENGNVRWTQDWSEIVDRQPNNQGRLYNQLYSVIVQPNDAIVAAGTMYRDDDGDPTQDGLLVRLEPDQLQPIIYYYEPQDTIFSVIPSDTVDFLMRARDQQGDELSNLWIVDYDTLEVDTLGADTTQSVIFDSLGVYLVRGQVSDGQFTIERRWHVTAEEWYIDSYSPDSLAWTVRRPYEVDFGLGVRALDDVEPRFCWILTDREHRQVDVGNEAELSYTFDIQGNYFLEGRAFYEDTEQSVIWQVAVNSVLYWWRPHVRQLEAEPRQEIEFSVIPFNLDSDSLEYLWLIDGEDDGDIEDGIFARFNDVGEHHVTSIVHDGAEVDTVIWTVTVVEENAVEDDSASLLPTEVTLFPAAPNPFNSTASIRYFLPRSADVRLTVYDSAGRLVRVLSEGMTVSGENRATIHGAELPAGIYLLRLDTGSAVRSMKVVLLK